MTKRELNIYTKLSMVMNEMDDTAHLDNDTADELIKDAAFHLVAETVDCRPSELKFIQTAAKTIGAWRIHWGELARQSVLGTDEPIRADQFIRNCRQSLHEYLGDYKV